MQNTHPTAGLVKVVNPKDPESFLWADQKQINAHGLTPWGDRAEPAAPAADDSAADEGGEGEGEGEGGADPTKIRRQPKK